MTPVRLNWARTLIIVTVGSMTAAEAWAANWGTFNRDECVALGKRQYSSRLWNIVGTWEAACAAQGATVQGQRFTHPTRCVNRGIGGMWGEFDVDDPGCVAHWGLPIQRDACSGIGLRQYSARLWDVPARVGWLDACAGTPADVGGMRFASPTRCKDLGVGGVWGEFDAPDSDCPRWSDWTPSVCCDGLGRRMQSARLWDVPASLSWDAACSATPATIGSETFPRPDRCEDRGAGGEWGYFRTADATCAGTWVRPSSTCTAKGTRTYQATLEVPCGVKPAEACPVTQVAFGGASPLAPTRCSSGGRIGQVDVADACCLPTPGPATDACAPAASPPAILAMTGLASWPNDAMHYSGGGAFTLDVRRGLGNRFRVTLGGVILHPPGFAGPATLQMSDIRIDPSAWTVVTRLSIVPAPTTSQAALLDLALEEESSNPAYPSGPQHAATSHLKVTVWKVPCAVSLTAPSTVETFTTYRVAWAALGCKQYTLRVNGSDVFSETAIGPAADFHRDSAEVANASVAWTLEGANTAGAKNSTQSLVQVGCAGGGQPRDFNLCATCPSDIGPYQYSVAQRACSESQAIQFARRSYSNCTVAAGNCP